MLFAKPVIDESVCLLIISPGRVTPRALREGHHFFRGLKELLAVNAADCDARHHHCQGIDVDADSSVTSRSRSVQHSSRAAHRVQDDKLTFGARRNRIERDLWRHPRGEGVDCPRAHFTWSPGRHLCDGACQTTGLWHWTFTARRTHLSPLPRARHDMELRSVDVTSAAVPVSDVVAAGLRGRGGRSAGDSLALASARHHSGRWPFERSAAGWLARVRDSPESRVPGLTPRASARCTMLRRLTLRSPRSTEPT